MRNSIAMYVCATTQLCPEAKLFFANFSPFLRRPRGPYNKHTPRPRCYQHHIIRGTSCPYSDKNISSCSTSSPRKIKAGRSSHSWSSVLVSQKTMVSFSKFLLLAAPVAAQDLRGLGNVIQSLATMRDSVQDLQNVDAESYEKVACHCDDETKKLVGGSAKGLRLVFCCDRRRIGCESSSWPIS